MVTGKETYHEMPMRVEEGVGHGSSSGCGWCCRAHGKEGCGGGRHRGGDCQGARRERQVRPPSGRPLAAEALWRQLQDAQQFVFADDVNVQAGRLLDHAAAHCRAQWRRCS